MGGVYSIMAMIVTALIVGIVLTSNNTAPIVSTVVNGFGNALRAAKP